MKGSTAQTKLAGVIGKPVAHSLSPRLHSFLIEQTGLDMAYLAFDIEDAEKLRTVLEGARHMGISGFNITSPYKIDAFHLADEVDEEALRVGNINTLVNREGRWCGSNTDGEGFIRTLKRHGISVAGKHILIAGTGGTARTLSYRFSKYGAASITILSRKDDAVAEISQVTVDFPDVKLYQGLDSSRQYDIVVNCTPMGMGSLKDKNPMPADFPYHERMLCCDLIYNPAKTLFLQTAEVAGAQILNGLSMLLYQGVLAFEKFTNVTITEEICSGLFRHFELE